MGNIGDARHVMYAKNDTMQWDPRRAALRAHACLIYNRVSRKQKKHGHDEHNKQPAKCILQSSRQSIFIFLKLGQLINIQKKNGQRTAVVQHALDQK